MPNSTSTVKLNADPIHDQKESILTLSQLIQAAEQGNVKAQIRLGDCYFQGLGVKEDEKEGLKWYEKAAKKNKTVELCVQGFRFGNGISCVKDEKLAFKYYRQSAELGFATAQCNLAYCYDNAIGTARNEELAFKYYKKAADQGLALAQNALAYLYQHTRSTAKNERLAFKYYKKAARQGLASAQHNLACCYRNAICAEKDEKAAIEWYHKAEKQGSEDARLGLRHYFYRDLLDSKDYKLLDSKATSLTTKYQLNYPQALALCVPDVQAWLLFGVHSFASKELRLIICTNLCFLPFAEFRNDMPLINAKEVLERELHEFVPDKMSNLDLSVDQSKARTFLNECKFLTVCPKDVKQISDKLNSWIQHYEVDSKQEMCSTKNQFYSICQRYYLFFQAATVAVETVANVDGKPESILKLQLI